MVIMIIVTNTLWNWLFVYQKPLKILFLSHKSWINDFFDKVAFHLGDLVC